MKPNLNETVRYRCGSCLEYMPLTKAGKLFKKCPICNTPTIANFILREEGQWERVRGKRLRLRRKYEWRMKT